MIPGTMKGGPRMTGVKRKSGGRRPGAGRPPAGNVQLTLRIGEQAMKHLEHEAGRRGINRARLAADIVETTMRNLNR